MAEAGIEESGIMDAEFAHHRQIGRHLGGIVRRDGDGLAAYQDIERTGVKMMRPSVVRTSSQKSRAG